MAQRLMLLDTASLYFRAFYGVPDSVTSPQGEPVNAVRGLMDFISRLVGEYEPTHLACCWDNDWRPAWRVELLPSYKEHRVIEEVESDPDVEEVPDPLASQVPVIRDVLAAWGIAIVGADGYEADDVIGTLATMYASPDGPAMPVDVVTGDRDLFQLVTAEGVEPPVRVLYVARGVSKHDRVDHAWLQARYGVGGSQYADFATLRGDASDGLPGVAGVGEKTAATLLERFGDLDGIRAGAEDPDASMAPGVRRKIKDAAAYLDVAPRVVAVAREIDLGDPDLTLPTDGPVDPAAARDLTERWGLGSAADRLTETLGGQRAG